MGCPSVVRSQSPTSYDVFIPKVIHNALRLGKQVLIPVNRFQPDQNLGSDQLLMFHVKLQFQKTIFNFHRDAGYSDLNNVNNWITS